MLWKRSLIAATALIAVVAASVCVQPSSFAQNVYVISDPYADNGAKIVGVLPKFRSELTVLEIPAEDTPQGAFNWFKKDVLTISEDALQGCVHLSKLILPSTIQELDAKSFLELPSLTVVEVSPLNPYFFSSSGILYKKSGLKATLFYYPVAKPGDVFVVSKLVRKDGDSASSPISVSAIGNYAFHNSSLSTITLSEGCVEIGDYAFAGSRRLKAITFPNGLERICMDAFLDCASITAINLPNSLKEIHADAFRGCRSLKKVRIPSSVRYLGDFVFYDCPLLRQIEVEGPNENYASMNGVLFTKSFQKLIQYPASKDECDYSTPKQVTTLGGGAFMGNTSLESVTLPEGVERISWRCFADCSALARIHIPKSVKYLDEEAFSGCTSLEKLTLSESVMGIGERAFANCSSLKTISLSSGLETIGAEAFSFCTSLEEVRIPDTVTSINSKAFQGCSSLKKVVLPDSLLQSLDDSVFSGCDSITEIGSR